MTPGVCIWCLSEANDSDVEHVFPESIGCPPWLVLPGTVVCKSCNSGMAILDQAVADEFDYLLLLSGVPRKGGRPPEIGNRGNAHGRRTATGPEISFNFESFPVTAPSGKLLSPFRGKPRDIRAAFNRSGPFAEVAFDVPFGQGKNFVPGILKIALNAVAFLLGPTVASQPTFQGVRDFVRRRQGIRHLLISPAEDDHFVLRANPPWTGADGDYAIEVRIATVQFLVDLSNDERHYPTFRSKALEMYGESGWTTLPTEA